MELHSSPSSSGARKKLWNILRVALFMVRKGSMSKRKLIMDMNLMVQRGKSLGKNLTFHRPHSEFSSCASSSPNPNIFFRRASTSPSKRKHSYFPCMGAGSEAVDEQPDKAAVLPRRRIEYSPRSARARASAAALMAERYCTPTPSPLSARVSNYSLLEEEEEEEEGDDGAGGGEVDNRAEEFIKRFYQQLHAQGQSIALIQ